MAEKDTEPRKLKDVYKEFMKGSGICMNPSIDNDELNENPIDTYNRASDDGDADALCALGDKLFHGFGEMSDRKLAFKCFERAYELGSLKGQTRFGYMVLYGIANDVPRTQGITVLEDAAMKGSGIAYNLLGHEYYRGEIVPRSYDKMFECYQKAAEHGIDAAYRNLAFCYENGYGTERSYEKALELYIRCHELGMPVQKDIDRLRRLVNSSEHEQISTSLNDF